MYSRLWPTISETSGFTVFYITITGLLPASIVPLRRMMAEEGYRISRSSWLKTRCWYRNVVVAPNSLSLDGMNKAVAVPKTISIQRLGYLDRTAPSDLSLCRPTGGETTEDQPVIVMGRFGSIRLGLCRFRSFRSTSRVWTYVGITHIVVGAIVFWSGREEVTMAESIDSNNSSGHARCLR